VQLPCKQMSHQFMLREVILLVTVWEHPRNMIRN
jgi:hypothetical protein